jgi:hypothetical protein
MSSKNSGALFLVVLLLTSFVLAQSPAPPQSNLSAPAAAVNSGTHAAAPATEAPRAPRFVPVLFSAPDTKGSPVLGLTKDQITILDSNQAVQPLQLYKGSDLPLHLGVVLLSAPRTFSQQQAAAIGLINKVIRPGVDEAFVIAARGKKPWPGERLDWKQDPAELATIIRHLDANAGMFDAFNFNLQTDETGMDESAGRFNLQTVAGNGVNVFDVIYSMMNSDPRPSRRVVLMFREPWSHSPGFGNRANTAVEGHLLRVIGVAQALHISTYVIGLEDPQYNGITDTNLGKNYISVHAGDDGGAGSANRQYDREMQDLRIHAYNAGRSNVERPAVETGGATYWSTKKNYSDAISAIANQLAGQYIVTFIPRDAPGDIHPLKITSSDAHVTSQAAYIAGSGK